MTFAIAPSISPGSILDDALCTFARRGRAGKAVQVIVLLPPRGLADIYYVKTPDTRATMYTRKPSRLSRKFDLLANMPFGTKKEPPLALPDL